MNLRDIPAEGLHRAYDLSGAFAADTFAGTEVEAGESHVTAELDLYRTGVEVLARGKLTGDLVAVCSRCVGAAHVALDSPIEILFLPRGTSAPDVDPDEEDLAQPDVVHYDDDEIDVAETLREELLLALPIAPLCSETCKGLCARCGKDLNEGPCDCPAEPPSEDRWSALRGLKIG